jgi:hypothetical protein
VRPREAGVYTTLQIGDGGGVSVCPCPNRPHPRCKTPAVRKTMRSQYKQTFAEATRGPLIAENPRTLDRPIGAALDRNLSSPTAPGEKVEAELDRFVSQRHDRRVKIEGERVEEEAWRESERRHTASRRVTNRSAWYYTSSTSGGRRASRRCCLTPPLLATSCRGRRPRLRGRVSDHGGSAHAARSAGCFARGTPHPSRLPLPTTVTKSGMGPRRSTTRGV